MGAIVVPVLLATACLGVPAAAQQDVAVLHRSFAKSYRAGKYAEALAAAQQAQAILEKKLGPNHMSLAPVLNDVAASGRQDHTILPSAATSFVSSPFDRSQAHKNPPCITLRA